MELNERLQQLRRERDWTQLQVAAALKVPRELISMWEVGTRRPNLKQLEDVARLFSADVEFLLGNRSEPQPQDSKPKVLLRGLDTAEPAIKLQVSNWLSFLDEWSLFADLSEKEKPSLQKK